MEIKRTDAEIDAVLNDAAKSAGEGSRWPGLTYETGVEVALLWVTGQTDDNPMEE